MKKVKWIMLAVVLCLGLIGGAYAYWTDQVVVSGTIDTGNFDVVIGAPVNYPTSWGGGALDYALGDKAPDRYERWVAAPTSNDTTLTFSVSNLYPRKSPYDATPEEEDYLMVLISFKNNGTVPVTLADVTPGGSQDMRDRMKVAFHLWGPGDDEYPNNQINYEKSLDEIDSILLGIKRLQRIEPGDTEHIAFAVYLGSGVNDFKGETRTVTLDFDWKQFNATTP